MNRACPALVALLVGCASRSVDVGRDRAAIIGGTNDDGDPAVVAVVNQVIGAYCSGTLVAPRVVLTAGHCLELNVDAVVFGSDATTGERVAVVATQKHPKYTAEGADFDLGVVVLEHAPTSATPLSTNHAPLQASLVGSNVRHVGFGTTVEGTSTGSGTKHEVSTPIVSLDATRIVSGTATANTCLGDSGGPAFVTVGGVEVLAGVVSDGPDCHSAGWDDRLDVGEVSSWLDAIVADDGASLVPLVPPVDAGADADASAAPSPSASSGCTSSENTHFSRVVLTLHLLVMGAFISRRRRRRSASRPLRTSAVGCRCRS